MDRDEIRLGEQFVELYQPGKIGTRLQIRVVDDDLGPKVADRSRQLAGDSAVSEQAHPELGEAPDGLQ